MNQSIRCNAGCLVTFKLYFMVTLLATYESTTDLDKGCNFDRGAEKFTIQGNVKQLISITVTV